jgi:glycosyltransferase involved in cell wall biosynthesis
VNLLTPTTPPRYCGEPAIAGCIACCATERDGIFEDLPVPDLLARSAREFTAAETVIAPSADAARRIARHFPGITLRVTPWEDDAAPMQLRRPPPGRRRILTIGGIGASKGFDLLQACARDAAERELALDFFVAGGSADDAKLIAAGIFVTGHYAQSEVQALIAQCRPSVAFLPSIWPETWCYTLSEAWRAGLYTVAFDLGAQAERIKATNRGLVLPLGLPVPRINDALLRCFT